MAPRYTVVSMAVPPESPDSSPATPLPIDPLRPAFLEALEEGPVVVSAPTGSGKSTRVPTWCPGRVLVVEPRRVACRSLAQRVVELSGTKLGEEVGYHVRDERRAGDGTRLLFATPGIVLRLFDQLAAWDTVVLDEFHERGLETDLLLALLAQRRPARLVAMSATLAGDRVAEHLEGRHLQGEGRAFPVEVRHVAGAGGSSGGSGGPANPGRRGGGTLLPDVRGIEQRVVQAVAAARELAGDVLVFLPGKGEIASCAAALAGRRDLGEMEVLELHGGLTLSQQNRAFRTGGRRKVILATNVAETSVTIPGVGVVVDSGLVRQTRWYRDRGFLTLAPIAADSAEQRKGRAGRTAPGVCIRLWDEAAQLAPRTPPEVHRESLTPLVLAAAACGARVEELPFLDPPKEEAVATARLELAALGAVDGEGRLTERGRQLFDLPLDAALGRLLVEARARFEAARDSAGRFAATERVAGDPDGARPGDPPSSATADADGNARAAGSGHGEAGLGGAAHGGDPGSKATRGRDETNPDGGAAMPNPSPPGQPPDPERARALFEDVVDLVSALAVDRRLPPAPPDLLDRHANPAAADPALDPGRCDAVATLVAVRSAAAAGGGGPALAEALATARRLRNLFSLPTRLPPPERAIDRRSLAAAVMAANPRTIHVARRRGGKRGSRVSWAAGGPELELARESAVGDADGPPGQPPIEAIAVLATHAVGSGFRKMTLLATCAMPLPLSWLAEERFGEERLGEPALEGGRLVATVERTWANRILDERREVPRGDRARRALVELYRAGRIFREAREEARRRLQQADLALALARRSALPGAGGPAAVDTSGWEATVGALYGLGVEGGSGGGSGGSRQIPDLDAWTEARLAELGFERGDELQLLSGDDLLPPELPYAVAHVLEREYPLRLDLPDATYEMEYDVGQRTVTLVKVEGSRKAPPSLAFLPRLPGFRVKVRHGQMLRTVRERR